MEELFLPLFEQYGYAAMFLLIFAETVFPPLPSEAILLFGGFLTVRGDMSIPAAIVFSTLGSVAGTVVLYTCGRILSVSRIRSFCQSRAGRFIGIKTRDIDKAFEWFEKYGYSAVLICRCFPIVRSVISVPAGMSEMKLLPFTFLTFLGSAVWNSVLLLLGSYAGAEWENILEYFDVYGFAAIIILGSAAVSGICLYMLKRRK